MATLKSFVQTVASAGTRVALTATSTAAASFSIVSTPSNTGAVYVGDVTVSSAQGALSPGAGIHFGADFPLAPALDLSLVYVDAAVSGSTVSVFYIAP